MVATIFNSIGIIILSVTFCIQMKEIVSLRKRCRKLEAECHYMSLDSVEGLTIGQLRAASRLQRFLDTINESERVSEAVPQNE